MGDRQAESRIFKKFLRAKRQFAGAAIASWRQPNDDPPDVLCDLSDGRVIGVELVEWLHQGQTRYAKKREGLERSICKAIAELSPNNTANIRTVSMTPSSQAPRFNATDASKFRAELLAFVAEVDRSHELWFAQRYSLPRSDFRDYPTLGKYLSRVYFQPRDPVNGNRGRAEWIELEPRGGLYTLDPAADALGVCLDKKIKKSSSGPPRCHEFHLLVHYTQGWSYNTPAFAPGFDFRDAARWASQHAGCSAGVFDRIRLFVPDTFPPQVYRIYPPRA